MRQIPFKLNCISALVFLYATQDNDSLYLKKKKKLGTVEW